MSKLDVSELEIQETLEKYFQSRKFKLLKWNTISFNEEGKLGYLGDHFRIEAKVQRNGLEEDVSFFVKTIPSNESQRKLMEGAFMFRQEVLFFRLVADKIISILAKARPVTPGSKVSVIPRCFLAKDDVLIMENLSNNFKCTDPTKPLPLDFFKVSIRALARYHAASIIWEEQLGKSLIDEFPDLGNEIFLNGSPDSHLAPWHAASVDAARAIIPMVEKYKGRPDVVKKVQDALPGLYKTLTEKVRAWPDARNVFCNGDLWTNNILFRFDEAGNPLEAVLIDFQLMRYAPPATDILMFLLFCADKKFRDENFDIVVREYYDELSRTLQDLDVQPEKVLPWEELQRTLKEMRPYSLMLMLMEYPLSLAPSEAMDSILSDNERYNQHFLVTRTAFCVKMYKEYDKFRNRFTEIVEELVDNYIVKA